MAAHPRVEELALLRGRIPSSTWKISYFRVEELTLPINPGNAVSILTHSPGGTRVQIGEADYQGVVPANLKDETIGQKALAPRECQS